MHQEEPPCIKVIHDEQNPVLIPVIRKDDCPGVYTLTLEFLKSCFDDAPITGLMTVEKDADPKYLLMREPGHVIEVYDITKVYQTRFKKGVYTIVYFFNFQINKNTFFFVAATNQRRYHINVNDQSKRTKIQAIKDAIKSIPVVEDKKTSEASAKRHKVNFFT